MESITGEMQQLVKFVPSQYAARQTLDFILFPTLFNAKVFRFIKNSIVRSCKDKNS